MAVNKPHLLFYWDLSKIAKNRKPGIVNQKVDLAQFANALFNPFDPLWCGKIRGQYLRVNSEALLDVSSQRLQSLFAAGDEDHIIAERG
jgi:hypothetical protein